MNMQASLVSATFSGIDPELMADFCVIYREREEALSLARQFVQLIKAVQRHRGMSMALLAGGQSFQSAFGTLESELARRLAYMKIFAAKTKLLTARDHENLSNAWLTLCRDWQNDQVIDNFELHSHVLEQLLAMLAALAKQMEQPVVPRMSGTDNIVPVAGKEQTQFRQLELLNFVAVQMPQLVEQIARIRGLSFHAMGKGACGKEHKLKLRYSMRQVRAQSEIVRRYAERLETMLDGALPLGQIKTHEIKLMFLLNRVEMEVFAKNPLPASGQQLFGLATDIIDMYLRLVDDGLHLVGRWHEQGLEGWLSVSDGHS